MLVPGLVIFFAVMRCRDTVGVRCKIVELGGSLVPVVLSSPASVAHESLLCETLVSERITSSHVVVPSQRSPAQQALLDRVG
jgi:hypothetical protein